MVKANISCDEIRKLYMKAYMDKKEEIDRITSEGIEKNRKGDCTLTFKDKNGNFLSNKKIKITQKTHDFKYGANIFMLDEFENDEYNKEYRRMFKEYFNLATVPFYWDALEPEEGKLRYDKDSEKIYRRPPADLCVEYCEENGILPKLHCLFYDKFSPDWLKNYSVEKIEERFENRVKEIARRYKGKMYEFEVLNELLCFHDKKTEIFSKKDLVSYCFSVAEKYLKEEILVANEGVPACDIAHRGYRDYYYMMLENAMLKGVRIDKIGVQNHLFTGVSSHTDEQYTDSVKSGAYMNSPLDYLKGLDILSTLNRPVEITEITVPTFGEGEEFEELQADMLRLWFTVFFSHESVESFVYWNTIDGYAYTGNPNWIENHCRGGLFHKDLTPKKSALMYKKLFNEIWHTDITDTLNDNGELSFRGFYGDYEAEIDGKVYSFSVHKNQDKIKEIII